MKEEFMGHVPIADSKWGKRTLDEALKQESIVWKIHEKSVTQLDKALNYCLTVVLSKEATLVDGQLAIREFKQACAKLTQQDTYEGA